MDSNNTRHSEHLNTGAQGTKYLLPRENNRKKGPLLDGSLSTDALYPQGKLELQQLCVAGSSVTEEFGIIWVPLNSLAVMFHG